MSAVTDARVAQIRVLADAARAEMKGLEELRRGRGWLEHTERDALVAAGARAAALDAAADIVAGVPV